MASPTPQPPIERVPTRTRTPLFVGLAALVVVGLLVWRPWAEAPPPQPSPLALAPTAAPQPSRALPPTAMPNAGDPATPRPARSLPPPDLSPLGPAGEFRFGDVDANVRCLYGPRSEGRRLLQSLEVLPPLAFVTNPPGEVSHLESMGWRVELQMNRLDTLFDSEWETIARSRRQLARAINDRPADFKPLTLALNAQQAVPSAVFRVLVVVEWYTRNVELAGRGALVAPLYAQGTSLADVRQEGCHAVKVVA
ncbi:MAG TPA: hypothetical protein VEX62_10850 [Candidatus Limnocylindrales bacterium]|nr:hypothetical protein [Candidatus Limnocylindrales bacterium]